jgi:hypothetical protein
MTADVPAELVGLVPDPLPAAAHFAFLCPFCQLAGVDAPCSTAAATHVVWTVREGVPPAALVRAAFHGVPCTCCGRTLRVHADHDLRHAAHGQ